MSPLRQLNSRYGSPDPQVRYPSVSVSSIIATVKRSLSALAAVWTTHLTIEILLCTLSCCPINCMGEYGRVWESVGECGRVWESMGECGRVWRHAVLIELTAKEHFTLSHPPIIIVTTIITIIIIIIIITTVTIININIITTTTLSLLS